MRSRGGVSPARLVGTLLVVLLFVVGSLLPFGRGAAVPPSLPRSGVPLTLPSFLRTPPSFLGPAGVLPLQLSVAVYGSDATTGTSLGCAGDAVGVGDQLDLTASASGGSGTYDYSWDYGDGSTDTGASVAHTFGSSGDYTITVTATDLNSPSASPESGTGTCSVSVGGGSGGLYVAVSASDTTTGASLGCAGDSVQVGDTLSFDAQVSGGSGSYTFAWDYGDGSSDSGTPVSHSYAAGGNVQITLTVTDSSGGATGTGTCSLTVTTSTLTVTASATDTGAGGTAVDCSGGTPVNQGDALDFSATVTGGGGAYTYAWDFGDGSGTASGATSSYTYPASGTYSAQVTATDDASQDTGTATCTVQVQATGNLSVAPTITDTSTGVDVACGGTLTLGDTIEFSANPSGGTGSYTASWDFGDGTSPAGTDPADHAYSTAGSVAPALSISDGSGASATWGGASCPLTVAANSTYDVSISIDPSSCGPVSVGGGSYADGDTATLAAGSLTIAAGNCSGDVFQAWATSGSVNVDTTGASSATLTVSADGGLTATFQPAASIGSNPCGLTQQPFICVKGLYSGDFLTGVSLQNTIGVWAASGGALPTSVAGSFGGGYQVHTFDGPQEDGGPFTTTADMGQLAAGTETFTATATFPDGTTQSGSVAFTLLATPSWVSALSAAGQTQTNGASSGWDVAYSFSIESQFYFDKEWPIQLSSSIPFVGGKQLSLVPVVEVDFEFDSTGTVQLTGKFGVSQELDILGNEASIGVSVVVSGSFSVGGGTIQWVSAQIGISINGEIVIDIPNPWGIKLPVIGNVGFFPEIRSSPSFQVTVVLAPSSGDGTVPVAYAGVQGQAQADLGIGASVQLTKYLQATLGGDIKVTLTYGAGRSIGGSITAALCAWATVLMKKVKICPIGGSLPFGAAGTGGPGATGPSEGPVLQVTPGALATPSTPSRPAAPPAFQWQPRYYNTSSYDRSLWVTGATSGTLVGDLYPFTEVTSAGGPGSVVLAYTTDLVGENQASSLGIEGYVLDPATGRSTPMPSPPAAPGVQVLAPVLAATSNGSVAALWTTLPDGAINVSAPQNITTVGLARGLFDPSNGRWSGLAQVALSGLPLGAVADSCGGDPHALVLSAATLLPAGRETLTEVDLGSGAVLRARTVGGFGDLRAFSCAADTVVLTGGSGSFSVLNLSSGSFWAVPSMPGYHLQTLTIVPGGHPHLLAVFGAPRGCVLADYNTSRAFFLGSLPVPCQVRDLEGARSGGTDFATLAMVSGREVVAFRPGHASPYDVVAQGGLSRLGVVALGPNEVETWGLVNYGNATVPLLNLTLDQVPLIDLSPPRGSPPRAEIGDTVVFRSSAQAASGSPLTYTWSGLPPGCATSSTLNLTCQPSAWGFYNVTLTATGPQGATVHATAPPYFVAARPSVAGIVLTPSVLLPDATGTGTALVAGGLPPFDYGWAVTAGCTALGIHVTCVFASPGPKVVRLTVTDREGQTSTAAGTFYVEAPPTPASHAAPTVLGLPPWQAYLLLGAAVAAAVLVTFVVLLRRRGGRRGRRRSRRAPTAAPAGSSPGTPVNEEMGVAPGAPPEGYAPYDPAAPPQGGGYQEAGPPPTAYQEGQGYGGDGAGYGP